MTDATQRTLADRYAALHAERERDWPEDKLAANIAQRRALVKAFDPAAVVRAGDAVAPFSLETADGAPLSLEALTRDGPVLLIFFHFAGCPACNIALSHYNDTLVEPLATLGVRIVAVSPHLPERGLDEIRARHALGFTVASDRGNALARRFGLTFLPVGNPPQPVDDPNWIGTLTGTGWELPQPAAVLIGSDRTVHHAEVSPDWMKRPEAETIIAAASALMEERTLA